jgi:hypothetical protein
VEITVFDDQRLHSFLNSLEFSLGKWNVHVGRDKYSLFVLPMLADRLPCALDATYPLLSHKYFE